MDTFHLMRIIGWIIIIAVGITGGIGNISVPLVAADAELEAGLSDLNNIVKRGRIKNQSEELAAAFSQLQNGERGFNRVYDLILKNSMDPVPSKEIVTEIGITVRVGVISSGPMGTKVDPATVDMFRGDSGIFSVAKEIFNNWVEAEKRIEQATANEARMRLGIVILALVPIGPALHLAAYIGERKRKRTEEVRR